MEYSLTTQQKFDFVKKIVELENEYYKNNSQFKNVYIELDVKRTNRLNKKMGESLICFVITEYEIETNKRIKSHNCTLMLSNHTYTCSILSDDYYIWNIDLELEYRKYMRSIFGENYQVNLIELINKRYENQKRYEIKEHEKKLNEIEYNRQSELDAVNKFAD